MPCRAIGGDFFDYVDLPSGEFGFAVGDVAGKGAPAQGPQHVGLAELQACAAGVELPLEE